MSTLETDGARSGDWDPALWSIGAVLGAAIVYLACLICCHRWPENDPACGLLPLVQSHKSSLLH